MDSTGNGEKLFIGGKVMYERYSDYIDESTFVGTYYPQWVTDARDLIVREWSIYNVWVANDDVNDFVSILQGMGYYDVDVIEEYDNESCVQWQSENKYLAVKYKDRVPDGYVLTLDEDGEPQTMYLDSNGGWDYNSLPPVQIPFYCIHKL